MSTLRTVERARTHYELLGVSPAARVTDIRAAYLRLARRFHPDLDGGSGAVMRDLNEAWAVLGEPRARRAYDLSIGVARPGADPDAERSEDAEHLVDLDDLADDRPLRSRSRRQGVIAVTPVALFVASVAIGIFGMMMVSTFLLGVAVVAFLLSGLMMVVVPLLEMTRSRSAR